ncbi:MAG: DEAD/DEAH box helicase family protein [Acidimicrobiales bacterium]
MTAEAQRRAAAAGANPRRRPTVPMNPSWNRDNRHVTFIIQVPVGGNEQARSSASLTPDPLVSDAAAAISAHFARPDALFKLANNQTLPVQAALQTESDYLQALNGRKDTTWKPLVPRPVLDVTTNPTVSGGVAVSVSVRNELSIGGREVQDLSLYDARMRVRIIGPARLQHQPLQFAEDDSRYAAAATVVGRGRGCVATLGVTDDLIVAETLPLHPQRHMQATEHGVDITFGNLIDNYLSTLDAVAGAMRSFLRGWDAMTSNPTEPTQVKLKAQFTQEVERFELGIDLLRADGRLARAFGLANDAFARAAIAGGRGSGAKWRLFQLVFIVTELGALAGRENPTTAHLCTHRDEISACKDATAVKLRTEIDTVDVLWFPTGGGKTEAYLGLIAVGLFYDRLRGKERGTSAWLLFPLRMLSVQQLARVSDIIHHADAARLADGIGGDPFALGYFVGSGNTPNRLGYRDTHGWWPGIDEFAKLSVAERDERRLVGACPACSDRNSVGLDVDLTNQRLLHVCRRCGHDLPIYASDDEVTRYQPAVVVSTVDKITAFARNGQLTAFNRGPRMRCPQHGWYTHKSCVAKDCNVNVRTHTTPAGFKDPTPALWIQDELHLVREELGVFAGHYHTLMAELAAGAGNEPSKVIAATATIEQFEDQLSQVYGRIPRMFPTGGPTLGKSFYTEVTDDLRRLYLGVLPSGGGTVKVDLAGRITTQLVRNVHDLMDDPTPLLGALAAEGITKTTTDVQSILFDYELALAYVNSKAHGVAILDDILRLSDELISAGSHRVYTQYLSGETSLGELAAAVAEVQGNTPSTPRSDRMRALVGTSVVSHGVDLDRLNFEVLAGMPPSYAHYIQATARAGRTHVGLVVSVFDRNNRRETSMFQSFATTHAALERMVEPVPVNRFASRAVHRTLPGIVAALLWDETRDPSHGTTEEIGMTRKFRSWWDANAALMGPETPVALLADPAAWKGLTRRIARAFSCPVPATALPSEESRLVADAVHRCPGDDQLARRRPARRVQRRQPR